MGKNDLSNDEVYETLLNTNRYLSKYLRLYVMKLMSRTNKSGIRMGKLIHWDEENEKSWAFSDSNR